MNAPRSPRPNAALRRALSPLEKYHKGKQWAPALLKVGDGEILSRPGLLDRGMALLLAAAAEEYVAFFSSVAESPKLNAARHRLQGLIRKVRGGS